MEGRELLKPGDKVMCESTLHKTNTKVIKTSEVTFLRTIGNKSALIEFTAEDGRRVQQKILINRIKARSA